MLNPELYEGLCGAVRDGRRAGGLAGREVKVVNANVPMRCQYEFDRVLRKSRLRVDEWGESYVVCCPFCKETRFRLQISHRWGVWDRLTMSHNRNLAKCFNEDCQGRVEGFGKKLADIIDPFVRTMTVRVGGSTPAAKVQMPAEEIIPRLPVNLLRLDKLHTDHPAIRFLHHRGHDPVKLANNFSVSYCWQDSNWHAHERLIIPTYDVEPDLAGGWRWVLRGWQGRYVGQGDGNVKELFRCGDCSQLFYWFSDPGVPLSGRQCPRCKISTPCDKVEKYYSCRGMKKSRVLMNYSVARTWPFGVVVEGPMDVFRVGTPQASDVPGPAVCAFGHQLSAEQKGLIRQTWGGADRAVILLLDPDVREKQAHLASELKTMCNNVISVKLAADPGDSRHEDIWQGIRAAISPPAVIRPAAV